MQPGLAFVRCDISRGAFSGERVFDIKLSDGEHYVGVAPRDACLIEGRSVGSDEPKSGQIVPGAVQAQLIRNGGDDAIVFIPDGEAVTVPVEAVTR